MFDIILFGLVFIFNMILLDCLLFWIFGDKKMLIRIIWEYLFNKKDKE